MIFKKIDSATLVSVGLLIVIFIFFAFATNGLTLSSFSIMAMIDQSVIFIIAGLGCVFVVSMGSADLSIGVNLGLSSVLATWVATVYGNEWLVMPVAIIIGLLVGLFNGFLVAKLKIPSFMVTLALLIGLRGLILYVLNAILDNVYYQIHGPLLALQNNYIKYPIFIVLVIILYYVQAHTKFGNYCKAIGENELVAKNVGVPVARVKIIAFALSGMMAGVASIFFLSKNGGTNNTMGLNLEVDVLIGIFVGGILVTGGYESKIPKLIIGTLTISVIKNGMVLAGWSSIAAMQTTQGLLLIVILFVMMKMKALEAKRAVVASKEEEDNEDKSPPPNVSQQIQDPV